MVRVSLQEMKKFVCVCVCVCVCVSVCMCGFCPITRQQCER